MKLSEFPIRAIQLISFLFVANTVFSQAVFEVKAEKHNMSKGDQMSYAIDIPQADLNIVTKNWIKLLEDKTKQKAVVSEHEIYIEGTVVNEIIQKPINVYSYVYEVDSNIRVINFYEIDSVFFDDKSSMDDIANEKMYHGIVNLKKKFAVEQYIIAVEAELDREEKTLKTLNSDLEKLEKENQNLHKTIKENEQNISESTDEIKLLENDNERTLKSISSQHEVLSGISDKDLKKEEQKKLKKLESEKKKIGNKIEKEQKQIVEFEAAIDKSNNDIEKNLKSQEEKKNEIEAQEQVVKLVEVKLNEVKIIEENLIDKLLH